MFAPRLIAGIAFLLPFCLAPLCGANAQSMQKHTTPNGIEYWHYPMEDAKRTAVAVSWPAEITQADRGHEATARLGVELMLNGGAGGRAPDELIADFQDLDSGARLWVQPREIRGFIVAPDQHLEPASRIANAVLAAPNLDEKWFEREKKKLTDRANATQSNAWIQVWTLARNIMLAEHPYRNFWSLHPASGVAGITLADVRRWHRESFGKDGMTITAAGNGDAKAVGTAIDLALANLPAGKPQQPIAFDGVDVKGVTLLLHRPNTPKSIVLVLGTLPSTASGQDLEVNLSAGVLGFGKQSRLFKAIRSELRAAYRFGSRLHNFTRDFRVFTMGGEVDPDKLQAALDTTRQTYETFVTDGIGFVEFPLARRFYRQRIEKEMKKPESVAYMMMENRLNRAPADHFTGLTERIDQLDRGSVNAYIKATFPAYDSLLKIVVSADRDAITGACVIESIEAWKQCF